MTEPSRGAPRGHAEFPFVLPHGYVGADGEVHREGMMRMSTAFDEIAPLKDPRVRSNPAYLLVILLSRVITRLGTLDQLNPKIIEGLYAADLAYLQDLYRRVNENGHDRVRTQCPRCEEQFEVELYNPGGSGATP